MRTNSSIALVSGGLDSCVAAAIAKEETNLVACLSVNYGQKHSRELESAKKVAKWLGVSLYTLDLTILGDLLAMLHATALVDPAEQLPTDRRMSEMTARVPRSYVPGRNTIFLALAQSLGEAHNVDKIYCGFNAVDFSGYPDCRPIFVSAWNHLAHYATKRGYENNAIELVAPIVDLSKASVVRRGYELHAPFQFTWSCYAGGDKCCGKCDSCIIRWNAFQDTGLDDPLEYEVIPHRSVL